MADAASETSTGGPVEETEAHAPLWRAERMDPAFSLLRHLGSVAIVASLICGLGLWLAATATAVDWLALPVFWLIANFFEWTFHRFPMHRPMFPRIIYDNHSLVHHRAFPREDDMEIGDRRELSLVMMPWYTLVLVFLMASPIAIVTALVAGLAFAGIFLIGSVGYFLAYEVMHTLHHLPRRTLQRLGLWHRWLYMRTRAHHARHHQMDRMAHVNFNVTVPLADVVLGTNETPTQALIRG